MWCCWPGRPSRLPATVDLVVDRLAVAPDRVLPLHQYRVGAWYPFKTRDNTRISDPKTATVVGGMLCALAQRQIVNLSIDTDRLTLRSTAAVLGAMENSGRIRDGAVLFAAEPGPAREAEASLRYFAPTRIGYRQLPMERWTATPLYKLTLAPEAPRPRLPVTVTLQRGAPDEEFGFDEADKLHAGEARKEELKVVQADDADGRNYRSLLRLCPRYHGGRRGLLARHRNPDDRRMTHGRSNTRRALRGTTAAAASAGLDWVADPRNARAVAGRKPRGAAAARRRRGGAPRPHGRAAELRRRVRAEPGRKILSDLHPGPARGGAAGRDLRGRPAGGRLPARHQPRGRGGIDGRRHALHRARRAGAGRLPRRAEASHADRRDQDPGELLLSGRRPGRREGARAGRNGVPPRRPGSAARARARRRADRGGALGRRRLRPAERRWRRDGRRGRALLVPHRRARAAVADRRAGRVALGPVGRPRNLHGSVPAPRHGAGGPRLGRGRLLCPAGAGAVHHERRQRQQPRRTRRRCRAARDHRNGGGCARSSLPVRC